MVSNLLMWLFKVYWFESLRYLSSNDDGGMIVVTLLSQCVEVVIKKGDLYNLWFYLFIFVLSCKDNL